MGLMSLDVFCGAAHAQVYSSNIVGYIIQDLLPGNNLIANQLGNGDNTLNTIFNAASTLNKAIPEGTTFTKWDASLVQFLPLSTYDTNGGWSINYEFGYGEGGELNSPSSFTNVFIGSVWPGANIGGPYSPPLVTGSGLMLLSCYAPFGGATFYDVVGRDPNNGESVTTLDALSQTTATTTFENGFWSNGDPALAVGQSAFFNLVSVPEPASWALLGAGLFLFSNVRRKRGLVKIFGK